MFSLIGAAFGFFTSFMPKLLGYFEKKRDQDHELVLMDKQLEQRKVIGEQQLQMTHVEADIRESEALLKHDSALVKGGSQWVKTLAASVRPILAYLFFIEFFVLTFMMALDAITIQLYQAIWNDPMQAIFASVVSFYYGSRTFNRMQSHS